MKYLCQYCQKEFNAFKSEKRLFCSKSCSAFSRKEIYRVLCRKIGKLRKSEEARRKIGKSSSLWKRSKEHIRKLLEGRKKIFVQTPKGNKHYLWKGNKVSYRALHHWLYRNLGTPIRCSKCKIDYKERKIQWANISHLYKRDLYDYMALCIPCHKAYDRRRK